MKPGPRADRLHVAHLIEAAERILSYVEGMTPEDFLLDKRTQDAVVRNFQIMGEAAKRVSAELRAKDARVPWREIAGFRDVLIHRYDEVVPFGIMARHPGRPAWSTCPSSTSRRLDLMLYPGPHLSRMRHARTRLGSGFSV